MAIARVVARGGIKGDRTQRFEFPDQVRTELRLFNDSFAVITFETHFLYEKKAIFTFSIDPGEVFDERLTPFQALTVNCPNGTKYRGWTRFPVYGGGYDRAYPR